MSKLDQLLDKSIDDIEDLPGFEVPVDGMYVLAMKVSEKEINKKDCIEAAFELRECLEQNDDSVPPTPVGTKFSTLFFYENEVGLAKLKEFSVPFTEHYGERNLMRVLRQLMDEGEIIIAAKVKRVPDRQDKEKFYADVSQITVQ